MGSEVRLTKLHTERPGLRLFHANAFALLESLEGGSVDLILTDPPYHRVKDDDWDRQWATDAEFLAWMGSLCEQWRRVLKPNGSLYVFVSPEMAGRVECVVRERFNVLNSIRWVKDKGWHQKTDEETLRSYLSPWEAVIFAEQFGADHEADGLAGYGLQCHFLHKQVFAPLGGYLQAERERAGLTRNEVEVALGYVSSADPTRGTALCCRWEEGSSLPTAETYERYRAFLNGLTGTGDYLARGHDELCREYQSLRQQYESLRQQYESLRQQYESLRQQYESLRRPFFASEDTPYADVWEFPTVQAYPGKHPCEKPQEMLRHIVSVSSRPGATVLDCFMGSGSTGEAALALGREFIGGDSSEHWARYACARLERRFGALPPRNGHKKPSRVKTGPQSTLWDDDLALARADAGACTPAPAPPAFDPQPGGVAFFRTENNQCVACTILARNAHDGLTVRVDSVDGRAMEREVLEYFTADDWPAWE